MNLHKFREVFVFLLLLFFRLAHYPLKPLAAPFILLSTCSHFIYIQLAKRCKSNYTRHIRWNKLIPEFRISIRVTIFVRLAIGGHWENVFYIFARHSMIKTIMITIQVACTLIVNAKIQLCSSFYIIFIYVRAVKHELEQNKQICSKQSRI